MERTLPGGRLDSERYLWRTAADLPADLPELLPAIAGRWLRAAGVGTPREFATLAGASQGDAGAALDRAGAVAVTVEGSAESGLVPGDSPEPASRSPAIAAARRSGATPPTTT